MQESPLSDVQVCYGDSSAAEARIYAALLGFDWKEGYRLRGRVVGPECEYAHTLSATVALRDLGDGPQLLARAVVPDPSFWEPQLPSLYRVELELVRGDKVLDTARRSLGIRTLGVLSDMLVWGKEPSTLRAAVVPRSINTDFRAWRDAGLAMVVESPTEALCAEASRWGVLLCGVLTGSREGHLHELARLARWPAVGIAIARADAPLKHRDRVRARNVLFAALLDKPAVAPEASEGSTAPNWARITVSGSHFGVAPAGKPRVFAGSWSEFADPNEARAACDEVLTSVAGLPIAGCIV